MTRRYTVLALATLIATCCMITIATTVSAATEVDVNRVCHFTDSDTYFCAVFRTDGTWLRDEIAENGGWVITAQATPRVEADVIRACHFTLSDAFMCSLFRTDGTWLRDEIAENGGWVVTTQAAPVVTGTSR
jgi:hypothetical protein